jgi:hypothetical protein
MGCGESRLGGSPLQEQCREDVAHYIGSICSLARFFEDDATAQAFTGWALPAATTVSLRACMPVSTAPDGVERGTLMMSMWTQLCKPLGRCFPNTPPPVMPTDWLNGAAWAVLVVPFLLHSESPADTARALEDERLGDMIAVWSARAEAWEVAVHTKLVMFPEALLRMKRLPSDGAGHEPHIRSPLPYSICATSRQFWEGVQNNSASTGWGAISLNSIYRAFAYHWNAECVPAAEWDFFNKKLWQLELRGRGRESASAAVAVAGSPASAAVAVAGSPAAEPLVLASAGDGGGDGDHTDAGETHDVGAGVGGLAPHARASSYSEPEPSP